MTKILIFTSLIAAAGAVAAVDYAINVWITTAGTNVTYSMGRGRVSLDEVKAAVKKVAAIYPEQTVHVISDEKTSMSSLFAVSKSIHEGGLTSIVVSAFCHAQPSTQSNGVQKLAGMSLNVHEVHDFELMKSGAANQASDATSEPAPGAGSSAHQR